MIYLRIAAVIPERKDKLDPCACAPFGKLLLFNKLLHGIRFCHLDLPRRVIRCALCPLFRHIRGTSAEMLNIFPERFPECWRIQAIDGFGYARTLSFDTQRDQYRWNICQLI